MEDTLLTLRITGLVLDALSLLLLMLVLVLLYVRSSSRTPSVTWQITIPPNAPDQPPKTVTVKQAVVEPEPPGTSCAHCGTRIKSDPIRQTVNEKETYTIHACPKCAKLSAKLTLSR